MSDSEKADPDAVSLGEWSAVLCGDADEETRERVRKAVEDVSTPLGAFVHKLREDDPSFLGRSIKARTQSSNGPQPNERAQPSFLARSVFSRIRKHPKTSILGTVVVLTVLISTAVWAQTERILDGSHSIRLTMLSQTDLDHISLQERSRIQDLLENPRLERPDVFDRISLAIGEKSTSTKSSILRTPVGTAILKDRPEFTWQTHPQASEYRVTILPADGKAVRSDWRPQLTWVPQVKLTRGQAYEWFVEAQAPDGTMYRAPSESRATAKFFVYGEDEADVIRLRLERNAESPLTLFYICTRFGLLDKAGAYLDQLVAANVDSVLLAQLKGELERLRTTAP